MVKGCQNYRQHGDSIDFLKVITGHRLFEFCIPYALFEQSLFETDQGSCWSLEWCSSWWSSSHLSQARLDILAPLHVLSKWQVRFRLVVCQHERCKFWIQRNHKDFWSNLGDLAYGLVHFDTKCWSLHSLGFLQFPTCSLCLDFPEARSWEFIRPP